MKTLLGCSVEKDGFQEMRRDTGMKTERKVSSKEAGFNMENMQFEDECRNRAMHVLTNKNQPKTQFRN